MQTDTLLRRNCRIVQFKHFAFLPCLECHFGINGRRLLRGILFLFSQEKTLTGYFLPEIFTAAIPEPLTTIRILYHFPGDRLFIV